MKIIHLWKCMFLILFIQFPTNLIAQSDSLRIEKLFQNLSSQVIYWTYHNNELYWPNKNIHAFLPIQIVFDTDSSQNKIEYQIIESKLLSSNHYNAPVFFYYSSFYYDLNNIRTIKSSDGNEINYFTNQDFRNSKENLKSDLCKIQEFEYQLEKLYNLRDRNKELSDQIPAEILNASLLTLIGIGGLKSNDRGYKRTLIQIGGAISLSAASYLVYSSISNFFERLKNESKIEEINTSIENIIRK